MSLQHNNRAASTIVGRLLLVVMVLAVTLVAAPPVASPNAGALVQAGPVSLEVWGITDGIVNNPKQWKFRQSTSAANDLGSAGAADPALDDTGWETRELRWKEFPGSPVANHFRKDFDLSDIGVERFQIVGMRVQLQYDDTAVLYLNGQEVYRSIRGNLDPEYALYPEGTDIPFDVNVSHGGAENFYVSIPDLNGTNECEFGPADCPNSPYGGPNPPEIPGSLLRDGVNTWSVTTWNQAGGGSGDSSLNHVFELLIDESAVPPNSIFINEAMASNDTTAFPDLDYPDWIELHNRGGADVDLAGWVLSDNGASWTFPSVSIAAGDYLVVVANDEDRTDTDPLQTNFKLSASGDSIKLTRPDGFVADEYGLPGQFTDNSYGRANNTGELTYLDTPTPGGLNSGPGDGYAPVLQAFSDRLYNRGEPVVHDVVAFDPDGDPLTIGVSGLPPGVSFDSTAQVISGTASTAGTFTSSITVTDADNQSVSQDVVWTVLPNPVGALPIVMNEFNAVEEDRELLAGSPVGNGGDWFEFVVIEDQLDLRGYSIELFDRNDGDDELLQFMVNLTFADRPELAAVPAGTILTISEDVPDDVAVDNQSDWNVNLQVDDEGNGAFFEPTAPGSEFDSTRKGQVVLIRDAAGALVAPIAGETEAWDVNNGINGAEVMNLCVDPAPGMMLDPLIDYEDNGSISTFGEPNQCRYPDPANPGVTISFDQDLSALRSIAVPTPTPIPTAVPTAVPTAAPTAVPTAAPTAVPTAVPTAAPTAVPTAAPTAVPTAAPTAVPTAAPTAVPTTVPTTVPTAAPTAVPTAVPTAAPTAAPTVVPTTIPTTAPTAAPTTPPTTAPTAAPTAAPTTAPTAAPTALPTAAPTAAPTTAPTTVPTSGVAGSPSLPYPGPFTAAPSNGAVSAFDQTDNADSGAAPGDADSASDEVLGTSTTSTGLAATGAEAPVLATLALLLLSVGGCLMVASRREDAR